MMFVVYVHDAALVILVIVLRPLPRCKVLLLLKGVEVINCPKDRHCLVLILSILSELIIKNMAN